MENGQILIVILGMAAVTMACRVLPFALLGRLTFSPTGAAWVRYLPIAILSACIFPQLFLSTTEVVWGPVNLSVLAALPTVLVGLLTRNLLMSVIIGVSSLALLRTTL